MEENKKLLYKILFGVVVFIALYFAYQHDINIPDEERYEHWKTITIKDKEIQKTQYYIIDENNNYYNIWTLKMWNNIKINKTYMFDPTSGTSTYITYYREVSNN